MHRTFEPLQRPDLCDCLTIAQDEDRRRPTQDAAGLDLKLCIAYAFTGRSKGAVIQMVLLRLRSAHPLTWDQGEHIQGHGVDASALSPPKRFDGGIQQLDRQMLALLAAKNASRGMYFFYAMQHEAAASSHSTDRMYVSQGWSPDGAYARCLSVMQPD